MSENNEQEERDDDEYDAQEQNLFSPEMMEQIMEAKKTRKTQFESYWEKDENDIDAWSKEQIKSDPNKQLLTLAESNNLKEIKELFSKQADNASIEKLLMFKDDDGYTALHRAAYSNSLDVVKYLMTFEDDPVAFPNINQLEVKTEMGWTPLHSAVYWNSYKVVEYFLQHPSCDVNMRTTSGQTSLHIAAQSSSNHGSETILLLLTHPSIDYDIENNQGETSHVIADRSSKFNALFEIADENLTHL